MLDFEENQKSKFAPSLFKSLPSEIPDHSGDTAWRSVAVVVLDITCSSSLDLFRFIDVRNELGVPYRCSILKGWEENCVVGPLFDFLGAV